MKRDKKGRFVAIGKKAKERASFNQRYKKASEVNALIEDAYKAGFETARRVPKTFGVKQCYEGFKSFTK